MRQPEYLNKAIASKRAGLSVRRLLELASRGVIRKKLITDPKNGNRALAVFAASDIERLKHRERSSTELQISGPVRPIAALPHSDSASVISPTRPWLTVAEAGEYSGLPSSFITRLVEAGKLPGLDVGVRPGGRWRVAKRDLDALKGERQANK